MDESEPCKVGTIDFNHVIIMWDVDASVAQSVKRLDRRSNKAVRFCRLFPDRIPFFLRIDPVKSGFLPGQECYVLLVGFILLRHTLLGTLV